MNVHYGKQLHSMNYAESIHYLYSLGHEVLAAKFDLTNIRILLERLGHPEKTYDAILVAGTNGKGSVSAMIESIARSAGQRTALYTSPHLVCIEERIQVGGQTISQDDFARLGTMIRDVSESLVQEKKLQTVPTYFEQVTAIALCYFAECGIKLAILEVGLGGRLDATNAVKHIVSAITSIDYDHEEILGHTIEQIAGEKAGIIHTGTKPVIGRQAHQQAFEVLKHRSYEMGEKPILVNRPTSLTLSNIGQPTFTYQSAKKTYTDMVCGLRGRHQADNAAVAIEIAEYLSEIDFIISEEAIRNGLRDVRWAGRLELLQANPSYLFDGSHNPAGAKTLKNYLKEIWQRPLTLVFGAMSDKDINGMATELFSLPDALILTRVDEPRAASFEQLREAARIATGNVFFADTVSQALSKAKEITPNDGLICISGSLYLVGAAKALMQSAGNQ